MQTWWLIIIILFNCDIDFSNNVAGNPLIFEAATILAKWSVSRPPSSYNKDFLCKESSK